MTTGPVSNKRSRKLNKKHKQILKMKKFKLTIFCISAICNNSSTSLRLVAFKAGVLNFLLRKHAIALPKYMRRSLRVKPLLKNYDKIWLFFYFNYKA